ncbi:MULTISPECIES: methyltransferase [unclassified Anaeromyxobacter]|uniref:methyltransferase n=1 Tax=unclassified Anaeromyxobacter TaxID=2620896 RepID=UPI001F58CB6F|nr:MULTISPECIES: methyltransferase [unclassified Anaeromyxobacter]
MISPPLLIWRTPSGERRAAWLSQLVPAPARAGAADDRTTAAAAVARASSGEALVYEGDYHNARQLLTAMARRLARPGQAPSGARRRGRPAPGARRPALPLPPPTQDLASEFRRERALKRLEHEVLTRLVVPVEAGWRVALPRAPDVASACEEALGPMPQAPGLLPLRELLGIVGAHEWRRRGVEVRALGARVHPRYGVYAPVRAEYVDLVAAAAAEWPVAGKRAYDVGTGTGVLALVLARAGARVVATDVESAAVACARENAARLGLADRVEVVQADLFPEDGAPVELVVSNPPWLPAEAASPLERAVYDPGGRFLDRLLRTLPARLAPGGEAWIVISDLAERLGLRPPGAVEALAVAAGLVVRDVRETRPAHPRVQDREDPLHAARAAERTRLYRLGAAPPG